MPGVVYGAVLLGTALVQRRMFKNKDLINKAVHRCPVITRTADLRERLATHRDEIGPLQYPLLMDNIHPTLQATKGKVKIVLF